MNNQLQHIYCYFISRKSWHRKYSKYYCVISGAQEYNLLECDAPCGQVEIYRRFREKVFLWERIMKFSQPCSWDTVRLGYDAVSWRFETIYCRKVRGFKLSEINVWMLKIEDTTFLGNVGIRLPVLQRHITEELNPCCLIFVICGAYMDKIGWSEIWYFCCRDNMESKKSLPFVLGVQTQNVRDKTGISQLDILELGKYCF